MHTKNFHWTRCPMITSEYNNRKSGISTDCTWSTVILGNIDTFGDAPACPLQIRSFSCPPVGSLWSEMCLLFGSHIWLAFQWEQEAWDQSVRHARWGGGRGGSSMRGVRLGATGDSQAGKSVLHQWSAIPACPTRREGQGLVMGTVVSLRPGITTTTPSDGPGPGSSQKASSWGQDREVQGWVQTWLWCSSGKDPGRGPQAEQGSSGKDPTAFPPPNFDLGMGADPAHRQPKHSEGERGHKSSRYALDLASAVPNLRVEVNDHQAPSHTWELGHLPVTPTRVPLNCHASVRPLSGFPCFQMLRDSGACPLPLHWPFHEHKHKPCMPFSPPVLDPEFSYRQLSVLPAPVSQEHGVSQSHALLLVNTKNSTHKKCLFFI